MSALVEFLLARIAEDEAMWSPAAGIAPDEVVVVTCRGGVVPPSEVAPSLTPGRMLRECEAKRRIVHAVDVLTGGEKTYLERMKHTDIEDSRYVIARDILAHLASVYADHPDYLPEWKP